MVVVALVVEEKAVEARVHSSRHRLQAPGRV